MMSLNIGVFLLLNSQIIVGMEGSPSTLNPIFAQDAYSVRVLSLIYDGLLRMDPKLRFCLAEKLEINGRTIIVRLRKGVKFHDGEELTSDHVVCTINTVKESASPRASAFRYVSKVEPISRYEFKIVLEKEFAPILAALAQPIFSKKLSGTGPFILESFIPGEKVVLRRNPEYFLGAPKIEKLVIRIIPDDITRVLELKKGGVDILINSVPYHINLDGFKVYVSDSMNFSYIALNTRRLSKKVRLAIAHAIDRDAIIKGILFNFATKAESIFPKWHWAFYPAYKYEYNPELARKLIEESSSESTIIYKTSTNKLSLRIARAIEFYLERIGLDVKLIPKEFTTFFSEIQKGFYDIHTLTWVGIIEPDILRFIFHSDSIPPIGANRTFYENLYLDKILEMAAFTSDVDLRRKLYIESQKIIAEDVPYIYLWHLKDVVAANPKINGIKPIPGGDFWFLKDVYF